MYSNGIIYIDYDLIIYYFLIVYHYLKLTLKKKMWSKSNSMVFLVSINDLNYFYFLFIIS